MWTPKRVLLVMVAFTVLCTGYKVYAHFLGGIDGLPPLPAKYLPIDDNANVDRDIPIKPPNPADEKLRIAFAGDKDDHPVLKRAIKLAIRNKGMYLAVDQFEIEKSNERKGQVRLEPFSIAIFGKPADGTGIPEVNTISSEVAYLKFDQPLNNLTELNDRKVIGGELHGAVEIVNNRRTLERNDDLCLYTSGPVTYDQSQNRIWTELPVKLIDPQSKPEPTKISGFGMDVHLAPDKPPEKKDGEEAVKGKKQNISGVERVVLRSSVEMFLYTGSGFLAGNKSGTGKEKATQGNDNQGTPAKVPTKDKVVITTGGPFTYDLLTDRATFDIPQAKQPTQLPENVVVTRIHEQGKREQGNQDQLVCDHLTLQFHRKTSATKQESKEDSSVDLEIDSAHATGATVTLTSDGEGLEAVGNELTYNARTRESTLKGAPMEAMKDGHKIVAPELCLKGLGEKQIQEALARGPGQIDMFDRNTNKQTLHARWQDGLTYTKEGQEDILILAGGATFEDETRSQQLRADSLKVWFQSDPAGGGAGSLQQRVRPHRLEARGHVRADSAELQVKEPTEHLIVWFKDAPANAPLASAGPEKGGLPAPGGRATDAAGGQAPPAGGPTTTPQKQKKPIILSAHSIEVHLCRAGSKNELEKLWCEKEVRVLQDPAAKEEKGVDIRGDTLQLTHFSDNKNEPEGNILVVTGNLALVQLEKLTIQGPEVNIDQRTNNAWVNGIGAMQMPATKNLLTEEPRSKPGEATAAPPSKPGDLTVHWNKGMFFNGLCAEFHGGIQAEQGDGRLACQEMHVFLDRPVSLREGEKKGQQAKVKTLVCDQSVRIEEVLRQGQRLVKLHRLNAPEVSLENEEGIVTAPGPGMVTVLQVGPAGDPLAPPGQKAPASRGSAEKEKMEELQLTRVNFLGHLHMDNHKRVAIFYDGVEVVHVPTDNPDLTVNFDRPPPGFFHMRCEQLKVFKGQEGQEMEARKRVAVQAREFWGEAELVKYHEGKDLVIFEGGEGGMAKLYRVKAPGSPPDMITGKRIYYWRKTNDFKVENGGEIEAR